jgi:hypothetical protein
VKNDEKCGRSRSHRSDENVENMWNLVPLDRRLIIRAVAVQLNLDEEAVKQILSDDLCMKEVSAKMVPIISTDS